MEVQGNSLLKIGKVYILLKYIWKKRIEDIVRHCEKSQINRNSASYYPNLAIQNKFYPEHLGVEFCDIYESIYLERKKYPKKKFPAENLALKLALNGSYGFVFKMNLKKPCYIVICN